MTIRIRTRRYDLDHPMPQAGEYGTSLYPEVKGMYEQMEPAREGSVHSDVLVPLFQSLITGFFGGAILALVTWYFIAQDAEYALYAFGISLVVIATVVWMGLLDDHKRLLWRVERLVGKDFDGDGVVGEPETLRIELTTTNEEGFQSMEILDLPGDAHKLREFACAVLAGRAISLASWTGHGGLYSRREFIVLRDELLHRGWMAWRNPHAPAQGVMLTRKGREALERICQAPHPTERA